MKRLLAAVFSALLVLAFVAAPSFASERGTADEAKALLKEAMDFYKEKGKDAALAEFNNTNGKFRKKDLYVFVQGFDGTTIAHGANSKLVGKNMLTLKDADGKAFIAEFIEVAKTKGSGVVDYKWTNPETKKMDPKATFIQRIEGTETLMGCGYYK